MQPDPHRPDAQVWITSYATIFHRPGVPLFDLCQAGWAGKDPRMLFSWYAADRTTDPDFVERGSRGARESVSGSWADPELSRAAAARLPAHRYRRLHLNLPGLPEGSAFQPEPVMDAIARGVRLVARAGLHVLGLRRHERRQHDDAVLAIGHEDADGRAVLDTILDQGQRPPFDPNKAVDRFVRVLQDYRVSRVTGDRYAGLTFSSQFTNRGISYEVASNTRPRELFEALEPRLNSHRIVLLDIQRSSNSCSGWCGGAGKSRTSPANTTIGRRLPPASWNWSRPQACGRSRRSSARASKPDLSPNFALPAWSGILGA